jgi:23S rRNA pseudouridine1911/1915/1917 synthase
MVAEEDKYDDFLDEEESEEEELYEHYRIEVDKGQEPLRIDKFLMLRLENTSRNKVQQAAKAGNILANNQAVKPNYKVRPNDVISIVLPHPEREYKIIPENIPLEIIYEDDALLVINKPAGLVVHPGVGNHSGTLVHALAYHFDNLPVRDDEMKPGLVHRLDKDTSGLMVIAKNDLAMNKLAKQFFDRTIHRRYRSLVWGDPEEKEGRIVGHLGRDQRYRKKMAVYPDADYGKHAATNFKVIERFGYTSLVECKLETGRTHQIRVHMAWIGHPVFNDPLYGGNSIVKGTVYTKYKQFVDNCFKVLPTQALHAFSLGFIHPVSGDEMYFEQEPPEGFQQLLEKWRRYSSNFHLD